MEVKLVPGKVTVTEHNIIIEGFKVECTSSKTIETSSVPSIEKEAIKWAMNKLTEKLVKCCGP